MAAVFIVSFPIFAEAQTIEACAKNSNGRLRSVPTNVPCKPSETRLSWNIMGSQGPMGLQGDIGPKGPSGMSGSNNAVFQFVGATSTTYPGNAGIYTYTKACQQDYPGSRMCSSKEYMLTVDFPAQGSFFGAWIRPTFSPMADGTLRATDLSGATGQPATLTCNGWRSGGQSSGLSVSDTGQFGIVTCGSSIPVACCAPVQ